MKVNTDAALLGSIAGNEKVQKILEIGTGTGVIALMLAQRFREALIDAVEIDEQTALTAELNFKNSPFSERIRLVRSSFAAHYLNTPGKLYDLIVSNPPYFINSLRSEDPSKDLARHTNSDFFKSLISGSSEHLSVDGLVYLILPMDTTELVEKLLPENGQLCVIKKIHIHSFPDSKPYRCILVLGFGKRQTEEQKFVIYERQNTYTAEYRAQLKDFLTIF
jgi:tRNA1Val (adenine37-N6)-methyltransferase